MWGTNGTKGDRSVLQGDEVKELFTEEMTQISIPLIFIGCQLALISMLEDFTGIASFELHKIPVKQVLLAL